jgi:hypothetical protein
MHTCIHIYTCVRMIHTFKHGNKHTTHSFIHTYIYTYIHNMAAERPTCIIRIKMVAKTRSVHKKTPVFSFPFTNPAVHSKAVARFAFSTLRKTRLHSSCHNSLTLSCASHASQSYVTVVKLASTALVASSLSLLSFTWQASQ